MARVYSDFIQMRGGIDYEVATIQAAPGSLADCLNYEVSESGYQRVLGYERFDGQVSPSTIDLVYNVDGTIDDTAREAQRALITAVPGSGPVRGAWVFNDDVYAFRDAVDGLSCKMYKASVTGWVEIALGAGITLAPGGKYRFVNYNFYAGSGSQMMYGCDGKNKAFQFDGTTFTQITTGMTVDAPGFIEAHAFHLFLGFAGGSLQHSAPGDPLDWNVVNGAGEIGVGDEITGIKSSVGGTLSILMKDRLSILYGTSSLDWQSQEVRSQQSSIGAIADTIQNVATDTIFCDANGITSLQATNNFGDFTSSLLSNRIARYMRAAGRLTVGSCIVRQKSQYRIFIDRGEETEIIALAFGGQGTLGFSKQVLPVVLSCIASGEISGQEAIFYGGSDGFLYKAETGESYDGLEIAAFIRSSFASQRSPYQRKRYKRANISLQAQELVDLRVKPEFSFANEDVASHSLRDISAIGGGGYWGSSLWGEFIWSAPEIGQGHVDITGTGTSIALVVYSTSKHSKPHTINSFNIDYIRRRIER